MKGIVLAVICSLFLTLVSGIFALPILRKLKVGQPILHYVETHKQKNGTPTMGGLFFILPSAIIFIIFSGLKNRLSLVCLSIGLAYLVVGFLDDYIKIKFKKNEGLKPYQKIIFQIAIAIMAGVYGYKNGFSVFYVPFAMTEVNVGIFAIPIITIIFLAITNSVNLTDGLDGLAGQVSLVYFIFLIVLITVQYQASSIIYISLEQYHELLLLSASLIGGIMGFLFFNMSKAKVFMGDTGSLSLGGFIGAISIFSLNSFFIPILGIMFVLSSISVIIQVLYFKKTRKRILLMAPLHHHFQLKGYTETQIGYTYALITAIFGMLAVLPYL
ncbi:MAG: phospho-N-acetylmuramoyl-pentapeptide-transferase [Clostridiales bacterium]|nr:phospho-N-acetylmuramoyl-pentapeptide-transferase [Clostridiales bacterium]